MWSTLRKLFLLLFAFAGAAFAQNPTNIDLNAKGSRWPAHCSESGSGNAFVCSGVALYTPLPTLARIEFIATRANTGAATLAVNGGSAIPIKKAVSTALASGDIANGSVVIVEYDGTNFQLLYGGSSGGGGTPGGSNGDIQYNNSGAFGGFADGTSHQVLHGGRTFSAVDLANDVTGILPVANGGTGVTAAQGNGSKVQLGTGSASTNHCLMYDSNGNAVDSGIACSTGGGGGGIVPAAVSTYHWWPPSSANAMDDEFTGSTFNAGSLWTGVNTGSCTFTQNNDSWLAFTCPSNGSAESMRMQCQSLPSAPYTFATYTLPDVVGGSFLYNSTLILRESSTGKLIDVGSDQSNTTVSVVYWSSSTVDVARLASISSGWQPVPWYLTAGRSGTTLTWTLALGGLPLGSGTLTKTYSESLTAHFTTAPDQVCIGLSPYNVGVTSYFDFFRRTL